MFQGVVQGIFWNPEYSFVPMNASRQKHSWLPDCGKGCDCGTVHKITMKMFSYPKRCVICRRFSWYQFENNRPITLCYLTFGVIQSPLSQDLGQRLFHVRSLVLLYTKIQFVMNCLLVLPYLKFLGHYLRRTLLKNCGYSNMRALGLLVMSKQNFKSSKCQKSFSMITL